MVMKMSDIFIQIRAFLHYSYKHALAAEFGIRAAIEILLLILALYIVYKFIRFLISRFFGVINSIGGFFYYRFILPVNIRWIEFVAYRSSNPDLQDKSERKKAAANAVMDGSAERGKNKKKIRFGWIFVIAYILIASYIVGFHYFLTDKREAYNVFFIPEYQLTNTENYVLNTLLYTDEQSIACFFHGSDCFLR
jgi:hypothetical protein